LLFIFVIAEFAQTTVLY